MPTSEKHNIPIIISILQKIKPKTVLDIGFGRGKYGLLAREYCCSDFRLGFKKIDGIEIHKEYITKIQESIYDNIFIGDITKMKIGKYDVYLLIDCLEHIEKEKGERLIKHLVKKGNVVVSIPKNIKKHKNERRLKKWGKQEQHISSWHLKDFSNYEDYSVRKHLILLLKKG